MVSASRLPWADEPTEPEPPATGRRTPDFDEVYERYFDFIWRSVRRLGVDEAAVDDVVQLVFMVVHRRLPEFSHASSVRTWVFGIMLRVVREHRRSLRRKSLHGIGPQTDPETLADDLERGPDESTARAEAARLLQRWLDQLDDEKREVFVLAELEQMTAKEIAEVTGANKSTIYSRLRTARLDFERAAQRCRQQDAWRLR
jgi:RNA polymerase sigma-70 factor, ECF subfamily